MVAHFWFGILAEMFRISPTMESAASADDSAQFAPPTPMPDFFSPVFVKELRQGLRARRFIMPFVIAQIMAIIAVGTELGFASTSNVTVGSDFTDFLGFVLYGVLWLIIGVIMPLTNIGSLRPELSGGRNVELLLMSNLSRWEVVRGKWLVGFVLSCLMLVSLVPYLLTRYFVGGVDLIDNLSQIFLVFIANAVLTALAIGASGFGNLIGRILLIGIGVLSFAGTLSASSFIVFDKMSSATGSSEIIPLALFVLIALASSALYVSYGLQLARSRLRLFENPIDPPPSGLVIALMIFTPIVVGITSVATVGLGGWVAVIGLLVLSLMIDRGPGKDQAATYAQP